MNPLCGHAVTKFLGFCKLPPNHQGPCNHVGPPAHEGNAFTKHDYGEKTCVHNIRLNDHCPSCGEVERG